MNGVREAFTLAPQLSHRNSAIRVHTIIPLRDINLEGMQIGRKQIDVMVLVLCWLWALSNLWVGAMSGMVMSSRDPGWVGTYFFLVYETIFLIMVLSLFSIRLAAVAAIVSTIAAVCVAIGSHGFGYGPAFTRHMLLKIALRPGLISIALLCVSPIGAVELYLKDRRSKADTQNS